MIIKHIKEDFKNIHQSFPLFPDFNDLRYGTTLKSGKEATVHLVTSCGKPYALKIYRKNLKYSSQGEYMMLDEIKSRTLRSAVKSRSKFGKSALLQLWSQREYRIMKKVFNAGANIPKVYAYGENSILMEYIGNENGGAPKLSEYKLTTSEAESAFDSIIYDIHILLDLKLVHGDLSPFNILWFNSSPYIIDFPQVLHIDTNHNAHEKFRKDLENINRYFEKYNFNQLKPKLDELMEHFMIKKLYG